MGGGGHAWGLWTYLVVFASAWFANHAAHFRSQLNAPEHAHNEEPGVEQPGPNPEDQDKSLRVKLLQDERLNGLEQTLDTAHEDVSTD